MTVGGATLIHEAAVAAEGRGPSWNRRAVATFTAVLGECETQEWFSPTVERALGDGYIPLVAYYPPDPTYPKAEQRWMAIFTITKPNEENLC
jgi:hypothetical protein